MWVNRLQSTPSVPPPAELVGAQPRRALPAGGGPLVRERPLDAVAGRKRPAPNHQRRLRALATHVVLKHSTERRPLDAPNPLLPWAPAAAFAAALASPVLLAACTPMVGPNYEPPSAHVAANWRVPDARVGFAPAS